MFHVTADGALRWSSCSTSTTGALRPDWDIKSITEDNADITFEGCGAVVNGMPASCLIDDTGNLLYLKSSVANGNEPSPSWPLELVQEGFADSDIRDVHLAVVAGRPVLSFYRSSADETYDDLYYAVLLD